MKSIYSVELKLSFENNWQALLRMDDHITYEDRINRVEEAIQDFGLKKCANTKVGDPEKGIKGISGGERKRLAFAAEVPFVFHTF